jgi:dUTP pyrophosphatase
MSSIEQQLKELKELSQMDFLDDTARAEIEKAISVIDNIGVGAFTNNDGRLLIKYVNKSSNKNPVYSKVGDSGFDLRCNINEPVTLKPMERKLIPTGLFFELPLGYDMEIRSRSGLSLKNGVIVLNSPGTVDCQYRGEIQIILINLGGEDFTINSGDRIAQGLIRTAITDNVLDLAEVTDIFNDTNRGSGGFGHTGIG